MAEDRLIQLRRPTRKKGCKKQYEFQSGYLLSGALAVTAGHGAGEKDTALEVRRVKGKWQTARVLWSVAAKGGLDAALVMLDEPFGDLSQASVLRERPDRKVDFKLNGFPRIARTSTERDVVSIEGTIGVDGGGGTGRLQLCPTGWAPKEASALDGMSGGPVIVQGRLLGVLASTHEDWTVLWVTSFAQILGDTTAADLLAEHLPEQRLDCARRHAHAARLLAATPELLEALRTAMEPAVDHAGRSVDAITEGVVEPFARSAPKDILRTGRKLTRAHPGLVPQIRELICCLLPSSSALAEVAREYLAGQGGGVELSRTAIPVLASAGMAAALDRRPEFTKDRATGRAREKRAILEPLAASLDAQGQDGARLVEDEMRDRFDVDAVLGAAERLRDPDSIGLRAQPSEQDRDLLIGLIEAFVEMSEDDGVLPPHLVLQLDEEGGRASRQRELAKQVVSRLGLETLMVGGASAQQLRDEGVVEGYLLDLFPGDKESK